MKELKFSNINENDVIEEIEVLEERNEFSCIVNICKTNSLNCVVNGVPSPGPIILGPLIV